MIYKHEHFMKQALEYAQKAAEIDEVPIGAIVIDEQGAIIGVGFNKTESQSTQVAHAEMEAFKQAGSFKNDWRLQGCTLYVTLQPCSMCYSAALLSRVSTIVYGAESPLFGYHKYQDNFLSVDVHNKVKVVKGVLEKESSTLLKNFFAQKRDIKS